MPRPDQPGIEYHQDLGEGTVQTQGPNEEQFDPDEVDNRHTHHRILENEEQIPSLQPHWIDAEGDRGPRREPAHYQGLDQHTCDAHRP